MLLLVVLALAAPEEALDARVLEGEQLYADLEFEQAIVTLQDTLVDGSALTRASRARALVFLGLSQAQIGRSGPARASFTAAFRADPTVAVPAGVPAKIQPLIDGARADVAAEPVEPVEAPVTPVAPGASKASTPGSSVPLFIGIAGGVLVAGGGAVAMIALARWSEATDGEATQREAQQIGAEANGLMAIGAFVGVAGAVTTATAIALAVLE